jgi:hypothetical protein
MLDWALGILSKCQTRGLLLCELSSQRIDSFASWTAREAACGQERRVAVSKSAVRTWERALMGTRAMFAVKMYGDVL